MFNRAWALILLLPFTSACTAQICALLGEFSGGFDGDVSGLLEAVITADLDDPEIANVELMLTAESAVLSGSGLVSCRDGELFINIQDLDGELAGEVTGFLQGGTGAGDYDLLDGSTGTWEY